MRILRLLLSLLNSPRDKLCLHTQPIYRKFSYSEIQFLIHELAEDTDPEQVNPTS